MRDTYQARLDALADELADMCDAVASAMRKATDALTGTDLELAEDVGDQRAEQVQRGEPCCGGLAMLRR